VRCFVGVQDLAWWRRLKPELQPVCGTCLTLLRDANFHPGLAALYSGFAASGGLSPAGYAKPEFLARQFSSAYPSQVEAAPRRGREIPEIVGPLVESELQFS